MDASFVAPRVIGGNIQKFFVSSNLCQDGSGRLFILHCVLFIVIYFGYLENKM